MSTYLSCFSLGGDDNIASGHVLHLFCTHFKGCGTVSHHWLWNMFVYLTVVSPWRWIYLTIPDIPLMSFIMRTVSNQWKWFASLYHQSIQLIEKHAVPTVHFGVIRLLSHNSLRSDVGGFFICLSLVCCRCFKQMDDIDAMFSDLLGEMDLLTQVR